MWLHQFRDGLHDRHRNAVAKLAICLSIRNWNLPVVWKAHQPSTLARRKSSRIAAWSALDQNFAAVFIVASRQGSRNVVWCDQAKSKIVAFCLILRGIALQIIPELVREDILWVDLCFGADGEWLFRDFRSVLRVKDRTEFVIRFRKFQLAPAKTGRFAKANDENPLAMLRQEMFGVDDFIVNFISKFVLQSLADDFEGFAFAMAQKVLHIRAQTLRGDDGQ